MSVLYSLVGMFAGMAAGVFLIFVGVLVVVGVQMVSEGIMKITGWPDWVAVIAAVVLIACSVLGGLLGETYADDRSR